MPNRSTRARRAILLAGGCCLPLFMLPTAAFAQTTPDQTNPNAQQPGPQTPTTPGEPDKTKKAAPEGAIVITGFRKSVADSIAIKRRETSMVEAVSAEEIGKLPDVSIAESILSLIHI